MKIEGFVVSSKGGCVGIKPEYSFLTRIVSKEQYEDSFPVVNYPPGLYLRKAAPKKIGTVDDVQFGKFDVCCSDNQVWLISHYLKPTQLEKRLFDEYSNSNKDPFVEVWNVRGNDNKVKWFGSKELAEGFAKFHGIKKVTHCKIRNPKLVKTAIKLPFVPLFLDEYDIAKAWQKWIEDNQDTGLPYILLETLIKAIKLVNKG